VGVQRSQVVEGQQELSFVVSSLSSWRAFGEQSLLGGDRLLIVDSEHCCCMRLSFNLIMILNRPNHGGGTGSKIFPNLVEIWENKNIAELHPRFKDMSERCF
jgi:hypothetical protein